jgi:hypothetical protein
VGLSRPSVDISEVRFDAGPVGPAEVAMGSLILRIDSCSSCFSVLWSCASTEDGDMAAITAIGY